MLTQRPPVDMAVVGGISRLVTNADDEDYPEFCLVDGERSVPPDQMRQQAEKKVLHKDVLAVGVPCVPWLARSISILTASIPCSFCRASGGVDELRLQ